MAPRHPNPRDRARRSWNRSAIVAGLAAAALGWASSVYSAERAEAIGTASFQVIVHPSNPTHSATREFVAEAFFKRSTRWQNGVVIHPVDLRPESSIRKEFSSLVLKRSVSAVRSFWQQRIFSGRDLPPPELDSDEAVVRYVASSPGAVGYVSSKVHHVGTFKVLILR